MELRDVNLNLLIALEALLQERHVTRAGLAIGVSQPRMSVELARLRAIFNDELLVPGDQEYELTPLALGLHDPLQAALASLTATLARGTTFDPRTSTREFKIAASDYVMSVFGPKLLERLTELAPSVRLHLRLADFSSARKLAGGQLDLWIQPSELVSNLHSEVLFKDSWVCAVWSGNKNISDPITHEEWSASPHACFTFGGKGMVLIDMLLGPLAAKHKRRVLSESFLMLPLILPGTHLIAMLPSRLGRFFTDIADIRLVKPPKSFPGFSEAMTWNPVSDTDPAHAWLRKQLKIVATEQLRAAPESFALRSNDGRG